MLIQLIISQYKNGDKQIKRLLDSIELQQDIDFKDIEAIIINDGDFIVLSEEFKNTFKDYSFNIRYYIKSWGGISSVRRYGQELATANYIMFCDGDDLFLRNNALGDYIKLIKEKTPDIITAKFVTDMSHIDANGNIVADYFRDYNLENVGIHGKMFKRDFLETNQIKGQDELEIYEDSYYVRLCFALTNNKVNIDNATYFGKFAIGSLTRVDANWCTHTYCEKVRSNELLVLELLKRNLTNIASNFVGAQMYEFYYTLSSDEANDPEFTEYYIKIEKKFMDYFRQFSYLLEIVTHEAEIAMIEVMVRRFYTELGKTGDFPITNNKIDYELYNYRAKTAMYQMVTTLYNKYYS